MVEDKIITLNCKGLWDSGATRTCISSNIVNALKLIPIGKATNQTAGGTRNVNVYLVDIILPNNVKIQNLPVVEAQIGGQGFDVLLGMNIINKGDFSITNVSNKTILSFRIPTSKTIDYVKEVNMKNQIGQHGNGKKNTKKRKRK